MNDQVLYSIVVPVYNGSQTVALFNQQLYQAFANKGQSFEVIYVDDKSSDGSWELLEQLARRYVWVKAIRLNRNYGQHNATLCGMQFATGRFVVTMDDDLQHSPEDIWLLADKKTKTGAKVVIARLLEKKHRWYRQRASDMIRVLAELLIRKPKGLHLSSFRLMDRQVVDSLLKINCTRPYIPALIFQVTNNVVNADICHRKRKYGRSNYTVAKMFRLAGQLIINNPLLMKLINNKEHAYTVDKAVNL